jgi:hypothetical protein
MASNELTAIMIRIDTSVLLLWKMSLTDAHLWAMQVMFRAEYL